MDSLSKFKIGEKVKVKLTGNIFEVEKVIPVMGFSEPLTHKYRLKEFGIWYRDAELEKLTFKDIINELGGQNEKSKS